MGGPFQCLIGLLVAAIATATAVPCDPSNRLMGDSFCIRTLQEGSMCDPQRRVCTNPFQNGCLNHTRVCTSPQDTACTTPPLYPEVRIHAGHSDSSLVMAWIYQIVLMEQLGVPVRVLFSKQQELDFYNPYSSFPVELPDAAEERVFALEGMHTANQVGDCQSLDNCLHVIPQLWSDETLPDSERIGTGIWGQNNLYIPQITAQRHPSLVSFYGLQQSTPEELATVFPQPYTWSYYCQTISTNRCQQPDDVAQRAPKNSQEAFSFYQQDQFHGYFGNSTTVHVISSGTESSCSLNNITRQSSSGGYELEQRMEIYKAANATQSNAMIEWWSPDSLMAVFRGTDYAMVPVGMPEKCPGCSCGTGGELELGLANSLKESYLATDPVDQSPAYPFLKNLRIHNKELQAMLMQWGKTRYVDDHPELLGHTTRQAVCAWVKDHLEELEAAFPSGHPRIRTAPAEEEWTDEAYLTAARVVGGLAAVAVLLTGIATVHWKRRLAVVYAQVHFVWQVLLGFWLVSMAAVLQAKEPSDGRCLTSQWLSTLGFTLVLVPLVVKIATINYIAQTLRKREQPDGTTVILISPMKMFLVEIGLSLCVVMYLMVWTAYDPPSRTETKVLTGEEGNLIEATIACGSESDGWIIAVLCWQGVLLVCATVLAILTEQVVEEFKESRALGIMIYCQDLFLVMRVILFLNRAGIQPIVYSATLSFFLSFDALVSSAIYFVPLLSRISRVEWEATAPQPVLHQNDTAGATPGSAAIEAMQMAAAPPSPMTAASPRNTSLHSLGMGSASSADISVLIQNRLREAAAHFAAAFEGGPEPITAECSRNVVHENDD